MNQVQRNQTMDLKGTDVIGLNILTLDTGEVVETVKDIIYDPQTNRVRALLVESNGLFSDARVILTEDIKNIGKDAVIIDSSEVLKKTSDVEDTVSHIAKDDTYLTRTKIITEEGTELGHVTDLYFSLPKGTVSNLEVSQGGLKDMQSGKKHVKVEDILTIGADATIVRGYTEQLFEEQSKQQGMKGAFHSMKDETGNIVEQSKTKAQEMKDNTTNRENVDEWKESVIHATNRAQRAIEDAFGDAQHRVDEIGNDPQNKQRVDQTKDSLSDMRERTLQKAESVKEAAREKVQEARERQEEERKKDAVGKYVKINVLSQKDKVLAKRGDMVTHSLLDSAEKNGILDQVLENISEQPLQKQPRNEDVDIDLNVKKTAHKSQTHL